MHANKSRAMPRHMTMMAALAWALLIVGASAANHAPVASNDTYETWMSTPVRPPVSGVLTNDTDADTNRLTAILVSNVLHGSLSLYTNGAFHYSPKDDFAGTDRFVYVASDGSATSAMAMATITVQPPTYARPVVLLMKHTSITNVLPPTSTYSNQMDGASSWLLEMSYNMRGLKGVVDTNRAADVFGWYTYTEDYCFNDNEFDLGDLLPYADADVVYTQYTHVVIIIARRSGCHYPAFGGIGPDSICTSDGCVDLGWVKIPYGSASSNIIAHELGHTFGLQDSYFLNCQTNVMAATGYTNHMYHDPYDLMSNSDGHLSAFNKDELGWLDGPNRILSLTNSGSYRVTLEPLESNSGGLKAVKTPRGDGGSLYIEYRQPLLIDAGFSPTGDVFQGALFHWGFSLVDMTPPASYVGTPNQHSIRPTLHAGNTYLDPLTGNSYTVITNTATNLVIDIEHTGMEFNDPVVEFVAPAADATLSSTTTFSAAVTDYSEIDRVEFIYNYAGLIVPIVTATVAAVSNIYQTTRDTANLLPNGPGVVYVYAYDIFGNCSFPIGRNITVNNSADTNPPTMTIAFPSDGYTNGGTTISISADAADDQRVWKVEFHLDGNQATPLARQVSDTGHYMVLNTEISQGRHTLVGRAFDFSGNWGDSDPVAFTIMDETDGSNPWGVFTNPVSGQFVYGLVPLAVVAGDNEAVASIVYRRDGVDLYTNTAPPYVFPWDSTSLPDGMQMFVARICDASDNCSEGATIMFSTSQDQDADGMPSSYEEEHFGNPTNASAGADADGDGLNNLAEYIAGTDPTNAASVFALDPHSAPGAGPCLCWPAITNRGYTIYYTTNPVTWEWQVAVSNLPGPQNCYTDAMTGACYPIYYRIQVQED